MKRTKPRPTRPKGQRWPSSSEECAAAAEYLDYLGDVERREYKKSDKYKQVQQLADKFKKKGKS